MKKHKRTPDNVLYCYVCGGPISHEMARFPDRAVNQLTSEARLYVRHDGERKYCGPFSRTWDEKYPGWFERLLCRAVPAKSIPTTCTRSKEDGK